MAWEKLMGRGASAPPQEKGRAKNALASALSAAESEAPDARRDVRRSKRVYIAMAVRVTGNRGKDSFQEDTATETVNAHGCMVRLAASIQRGEKLTLTNMRSEEDTECRVASIGPSAGGKKEVGLEFTKPAGYFWHIAFPPDDWSPADQRQSERVRPTPAFSKRS
jgi:hypothetical protein